MKTYNVFYIVNWNILIANVNRLQPWLADIDVVSTDNNQTGIRYHIFDLSVISGYTCPLSMLVFELWNILVNLKRQSGHTNFQLELGLMFLILMWPVSVWDLFHFLRLFIHLFYSQDLTILCIFLSIYFWASWKTFHVALEIFHWSRWEEENLR